ncbi:hypothetical protein XENOCAPTIV_016900, partial [Xenoophorus captivus]
PSVSRFLLGPALILSLLAVQASCHGTCRHRVPSRSESHMCVFGPFTGKLNTF